MEVQRTSGDTMPKGLPLQALPLFISLHVPKTAGTALNQVLARMFGKFTMFHEGAKNAIGGDRNFPRHIDANPHFFDSIMLIIGHIHFDHPLVQKANRRTIILARFRDPVDRIVSLYDYIRFRLDHPAHASMQDVSLREAIHEHPQFRGNCLNTQLRIVFGTADLDEIKSLRRQRNYVLGRYDSLPRFLRAVEAISGLKRQSGIPHLNAKTPLEGVTPAKDQSDFAQAVADLRELNAAEVAFFQSMPPIMVSQAT